MCEVDVNVTHLYIILNDISCLIMYVYLELCSGNGYKRRGSVSKWACVAVQPTMHSLITCSIWMKENVSMTAVRK